MLKRIGLVMLVVFVMLAQRAAAQQAPVSILLDNVRELANSVINYEGDAKISATYADEIFKHAKQTTLAVDKALAAGAPSTQTVNLNTGNSEKPMTLAEIKAMCEKIAQVASISNAGQAITNTSSWPKYIADGTIKEEMQAKGALEASKRCVSKVDEALANGVPDSTVIEALDRKMTLTEGREMCIYVRDEAQKVVDKQTAAEEAQYEPFRKLLGGDKLRIYNDRLKRYKVYGAGGKVLGTPTDYRDSSLWCTAGVDRDGVVPIWSVDCWHFQGMAKVGSVTSKSGEGNESPSAAFH
jgi:hypothetical protein